MVQTYFRSAVLVAVAVAMLLPVGNTAQADELFTATTAITLPMGQKVRSFDISFVDPVIGLYFLADRTNKAVDVIETSTNTVLTQLGKGVFTGTTPCSTPPPAGPNDCVGPNGVLTVNHREAWVGDGDSTIKVIDLANGQITHTIHTCVAAAGCTATAPRRADELCFDPRDQVVLMANDAAVPFPFITFIPTQGPNAYKVVKTITMDGTGRTPNATNGIEQCQWSSRTGMFYLNIPEVNGPGDDTKPGVVLVISPQTMKIVRTFEIPLSVCAGPQGMAIGPENQILLGCNNPNQTVPSSVIINDRSGAVIHVLANEDGADEVWFNEGDGHYYLANGGALPSQRLGVVDAQTGKDDPSAITGAGNTPVTPHGRNHSVAADPILNQVYVPIANNSGSTVCSSAGGSDSQGCIAVFTSTGSDTPGHQP